MGIQKGAGMKQFSANWFTTPVIGERSAREIASLISDPLVEDKEALFTDEGDAPPQAKGAYHSAPSEPRPRLDPRGFQLFESAYPTKGIRLPWQAEPKLWMHTSHAFGYIAPGPGHSALPIRPLGSVRPDTRLKRSRVTITLDRLRVRSYPGNGTHRILLHFYAQNQTPEQVEDLHYNTVYRVREGEEAALRGYPLFLGLSVGSIGVRLHCWTINVSNNQDEALLALLESDVIKSGLRLATAAQPVIAPFFVGGLRPGQSHRRTSSKYSCPGLRPRAGLQPSRHWRTPRHRVLPGCPDATGAPRPMGLAGLVLPRRFRPGASTG